ncbi:hypothetical protein PSPO01_13236 [Paraphaeosphaeria sporulosa]
MGFLLQVKELRMEMFYPVWLGRLGLGLEGFPSADAGGDVKGRCTPLTTQTGEVAFRMGDALASRCCCAVAGASRVNFGRVEGRNKQRHQAPGVCRRFQCFPGVKSVVCFMPCERVERHRWCLVLRYGRWQFPVPFEFEPRMVKPLQGCTSPVRASVVSYCPVRAAESGSRGKFSLRVARVRRSDTELPPRCGHWYMNAESPCQREACVEHFANESRAGTNARQLLSGQRWEFEMPILKIFLLCHSQFATLEARELWRVILHSPQRARDTEPFAHGKRNAFLEVTIPREQSDPNMWTPRTAPDGRFRVGEITDRRSISASLDASLQQRCFNNRAQGKRLMGPVTRRVGALAKAHFTAQRRGRLVECNRVELGCLQCCCRWHGSSDRGDAMHAYIIHQPAAFDVQARAWLHGAAAVHSAPVRPASSAFQMPSSSTALASQSWFFSDRVLKKENGIVAQWENSHQKQIP